MAVEIKNDNFEGMVVKSDRPVLVDFWAAWCGPCRMLAPVVEELETEYTGKLKVCKVNVDENGSLAAEYGIISIPTVILFKNGKVVNKLVGVHAKDDYEEAIEELL